MISRQGGRRKDCCQQNRQFRTGGTEPSHLEHDQNLPDRGNAKNVRLGRVADQPRPATFYRSRSVAVFVKTETFLERQASDHRRSGIDRGIVPQVALGEQAKAFASQRFHRQFGVFDHDRDRGLPGWQVDERVGLLNVQFGL